MGEETIGAVFLLVSLRDLNRNLALLAGLMLGMLLVGLGMAMFFSRRLLSVIVEPISALSRIMDLISRDKDYAVRSPIRSKDELGRLAAGCNAMIAQIQERASISKNRWRRGPTICWRRRKQPRRPIRQKICSWPT